MTFATEAELCDLFRGQAERSGWICYPEQGGWDLLLTRRQTQVGIQAKLRATEYSLLQALPQHPERPDRTGPTYRAVLIGELEGRTERSRAQHMHQFCQLARHLRLVVLSPPANMGDDWLGQRRWPRPNVQFQPHGPGWRGESVRWRHYRWHHQQPVWVPPFVPTHAAGVPSPTTVSPYMIAACRLELIANERGWVCLSDARKVMSELGLRYNANALLSTSYRCTNQPADAELTGHVGRQRRWLPKGNNLMPSARWPHVMRELSDAGDHREPVLPGDPPGQQPGDGSGG